MGHNQPKRPSTPPERRVNGAKREEKAKPRKRPGWTRDAEIERSINAAVQDDYSGDR